MRRTSGGGCRPSSRRRWPLATLGFLAFTVLVVTLARATNAASFVFKYGVVLSPEVSASGAPSAAVAGCAEPGMAQQAVQGLDFLRRHVKLPPIRDATGANYNLKYSLVSKEADNCTGAGRAAAVQELYTSSGMHFVFGVQDSDAGHESRAAGRLGRLLYHCCLQDMELDQVR